MGNENDELLDSSELEEDIDSNVDLDDTEDHSDLEVKNRKLYARLKKTEEELKQLKNQPAPKPTKSKVADVNDVEAFADLRVKGYSRDEILEMRAIAKAKGISLLDAENDPFVQAGISGIRERNAQEVKTQQATPPPSSRPSQVQPKTATTAEAQTDEELREAARQKYGLQ